MKNLAMLTTSRFAVLAAVTTLALPLGAAADAPDDGMPRGYRMPVVCDPAVAAARRAAPPAEPSSRIIYMHRCPSSGCLVTEAFVNDSRSNQSTIVQGERVLGAFTQGDAVWAGVMACMRTTYAAFNVAITDVDPGPNVPHFENMVGGRPTDISDQYPNAGGVAPGVCDEEPNAITFTFDVYGNSANHLCWTSAQETAHAFGLDHELLASDPMTYLPGGLPKRFQPQAAPCGEGEPRACLCTGGSTQNSFDRIMALFGPGAATPPTVEFRSPLEGNVVQPKFIVRANAMDDVGIERVELFLDGESTGVTDTMPPYYLVSPDGVAEGMHEVELRAYDLQGSDASAKIQLMVGPPCTADDGCEDKRVCVMGTCLAGPQVPGGIGDTCDVANECLDFNCQLASDGNGYCVAACDGNDDSCPNGFECLADANVCWPLPEDAGCCSTGADPRGALLLGLGVVVLGLRRRSKPAPARR